MKTLLALILLTIIVFPVYAQEQFAETVLPTDKGTLEVGLSTIPSQPNIGSETKLKINFINKNTKAIQEHIDYSIAVKKGEEQVFGIPLTHTAVGSVTIPYEFKEKGEYKISVDLQGVLFQPIIPPESAVFLITVGGSDVNTSTPKSGCLIATAAFGSELAPQIQFLREYRDNTIMASAVGSSFLNVFNSVYYSFSPSVADAERNNPILQETVKTIISPLLGILQVTEIYNFGENELSVLTSGIIASSLVGAVYFWPVGLAVKSARENTRPKVRLAIVVIFATLTITLASIAIGNSQLMMITTSSLVFSFVGTSAVFSSWIICKIVRKVSTFL